MQDVVVVTGATGFLGSYALPLLAGRYDRVVCVVRPTSNVERLKPLGAELREADLSDPRTLCAAFEEGATLVNLASLGFGHAPNVVGAACKAGIRRAVFIGTTAVFTSLPARSRRARLEAETVIRKSGLEYTLLRPTMIYGGPGDRNIARLLRYLSRCSFVVVPGSGQALQQPVHVRDVAEAIISVLNRPQTCRKSFNLGGPRAMSFNELLQIVSAVLGRRVARFHVPFGPVVVALGIVQALRIPIPIRAEQVLRLNEDKAVDIRPAQQELGFEPIEFEAGVRGLAQELFGRHAA